MSKLLLELQDNTGRCKTYFIVISRPLTWCLCVSAGWFAAQWLVLKEWPPLAEIIGPQLKQQSTYSNWLFTNLPNQAGCRRWPSACLQPKGKPPLKTHRVFTSYLLASVWTYISVYPICKSTGTFILSTIPCHQMYIQRYVSIVL